MRKMHDHRVTGEATLEFAGMTLKAYLANDGRHFVSIRQVCGLLGLRPQDEVRRLKASPALAEGLRALPLPAPGGKSHPDVCLRADLLPGWLIGVVPGPAADKVLRQKLRAYQQDLFQMAWQVFGPALVLELRLAELTQRIDGLKEKVAMGQASGASRKAQLPRRP
jgi:hypothetical protein